MHPESETVGRGQVIAGITSELQMLTLPCERG